MLPSLRYVPARLSRVSNTRGSTHVCLESCLNVHRAFPLQPIKHSRPMNHIAKQYVVISPVRDEESYLRFTIESMLAQTVRPIEWVIVNDGSTDRTASIINEYTAQHPWIRPVHR